MGKLFSLLVFITFTSATFSQEKKIYKINPGQKVLDAIPLEDVYQYPSFTSGEVYFRSGRVGYALLNYNNLFGEMQFISPKKDTLSLTDEETLDHISIGADTFYYEKGYIQLIGNYGPLRLAKKKEMHFSNREKIGAFGLKSSGSIDTYTSLSSSQALKDLVAKEILTFSLVTIYYFGDQFNHFKPANKKNLLNIYSKQDDKIQEYLNRENTDFKNEADLRKLVDFIQKL